ncbi:MAG TPA: ArsR family transcriptional regulator [Burkholderiaceae bacterium]|nr:ArsR family transcriptional regulator [Burkholderiaceae bacterium]
MPITHNTGTALDRQRRLMQGTSGRIVELLRRTPQTIDEIAAAVGLTRTAVRAQLATLQRDGIVEERGTQRGTSKPARVYGVSAEAELSLSRLYVPLLTQLLHVLADHMPRRQLDAILHEVGRGLMTDYAMPRGTLRERVFAASALLNELGGTTDVEEIPGRFLIKGHGCPLAAATAKYPEACNAVESLLAEFIGDPVTQCCHRHDRKRCCFEVMNRNASHAKPRR